MNGYDGKTTGKKLFFIQQVFNRIYSDVELNSIETKTKVTVNVHLDSGDHYLFSCYQDLYASYTSDLTAGTFTDLCANVPTLAQMPPPTDNIEWVIKPTT